MQANISRKIHSEVLTYTFKNWLAKEIELSTVILPIFEAFMTFSLSLNSSAIMSCKDLKLSLLSMDVFVLKATSTLYAMLDKA